MTERCSLPCRLVVGVVVSWSLLLLQSHEAAVTPPAITLGPPPGVPPPLPPGLPALPATTQPTGKPQVSVSKEKVTVAEPIHNNAVGTDDSYSLYRNLMDFRQSLEENPNPREADHDGPAVKTIKEAIRTIADAVRHSFTHGFVRTAERVRRDADPAKKPYLDSVVYVVGSLLGKPDCSNMIACRTGKFVQTRVPGAQLAVMMMETMVPQSMLNWFGVLKKSVMDRSDQCDNDYDCQLMDPAVGPTPTTPVLAAVPHPPARNSPGRAGGANSQPAPLG